MNPDEPAPKSELEIQSDRLAQLEAEQAKAAPAPVTQEANQDDTTPPGDRAPEAGKEGSTPDSKTKTGTPSEAEKQEIADLEAAKSEAAKEGKEIKLDDKGKPTRDAAGKFVKVDKAAAPAEKVTYGKDRERRDNSWKALNAEKAAFEAEKTKHAAEVKTATEKLAADTRAFQQQQHAATPTPEKYEQWAANEANKAVALDKQAKQAEADGEFDKADKLRQAAATARGFEQVAKAKADDLRKNPPPTVAQQQQKFVDDQKQWVSKAAIDFPEFAKKDSPVQKGAADYYRQMTVQVPELARLPGFVYFCAERASLKTAADRVSALEKELGELKPKLAELEALTNPPPGGSGNRLPASKSFEQMTAAEQFDWLKQNAV